jgi:hypothetical protein
MNKLKKIWGRFLKWWNEASYEGYWDEDEDEEVSPKGVDKN